MIEENQADIEKTNKQEELDMLRLTHEHLKNMEKKLLEASGTVIVK